MFKDVLKSLRTKHKMTQEELSIQMGLSKSAISMYENGNREPDLETLESFADFFNVDMNKLTGKHIDQSAHVQKLGKVGDIVPLRVIASVCAGYGGVAVTDWDGEYETVPEFMLRGYSPEECFLFKVKGDSMYPKILDGDKIVVHEQSSVDSGDTAIVVYNGDEGTVKKVNYVSGEDWLELIPNNPEYQTKRIEGMDLENCHVFGKVIGLYRSV